MQPIKAPYLPYDKLRDVAASFLREHNPDGTIPVPIEEIVELHLKMDIIPEPGLHLNYDVDAFLSGDCKEIRVDEHVWQRRPERYRFSIAHEVSHAVLHKDIIEQLSAGTITQWKKVAAAIPDEPYSYIEWQAYCLAGLLLVPPNALVEQFRSVSAAAKDAGLTVSSFGENERKIIESNLGRHFHVSRDVIKKRMEYDKLW